MIKRRKDGFLQISFAWMFAIVVGIFILFLAIYISFRLINTEQTTKSAETGKEIGVLLNPLETGFETGKTSSITIPVDTRIYNLCEEDGQFGKQKIQVSQKSFNEWTETDLAVSFSNKYIFSDNFEEGKKFEIFSKPFEFPFKVADLVYISSSSKKYCFFNSPENIKEELSTLNQENIFLDENCLDPDNSIKVCFTTDSNCNIFVNYNLGYVEKAGKKVYFSGDALMYAGIFSDKTIYECQLKRLMERMQSLALIYDGKANLVSKVGCNSNLNILQLSNLAHIGDSSQLNQLSSAVKDIDDKNKIAECRLW